MSSGFEVLTVSQLNAYVRAQLDCDPRLRNLFVRGEISNFVNHYRSGHFYLSLKDENAVVRAVMFRSSAQRLRFEPCNGMRVVAFGRATLYDRDGQFQFYIDDMQPDGVGTLHVAFEQLRDKLAAQGLFDDSRKKPLPPYPERIGIVTSPTGAALQDILHILKRRWPLARVLLYPVLVQGDEASGQICRGIDYFSEHLAADVVIVGRGGGSLEDLWAFNSEEVAKSLARCRVPVVSAVGHETDTTIADFAADLRAPTPSAAAELVTPDADEVWERVSGLRAGLSHAAHAGLANCSQRLDAALSSRALREPAALLAPCRERLETLGAGLSRAARLALSREQGHFAANAAKLDALSPLRVLARGYAIALGETGVLATSEALRREECFTLRLQDGTVPCRVDKPTAEREISPGRPAKPTRISAKIADKNPHQNS